MVISTGVTSYITLLKPGIEEEATLEALIEVGWNLIARFEDPKKMITYLHTSKEKVLIVCSADFLDSIREYVQESPLIVVSPKDSAPLLLPRHAKKIEYANGADIARLIATPTASTLPITALCSARANCGRTFIGLHLWAELVSAGNRVAYWSFDKDQSEIFRILRIPPTTRTIEVFSNGFLNAQLPQDLSQLDEMIEELREKSDLILIDVGAVAPGQNQFERRVQAQISNRVLQLSRRQILFTLEDAKNLNSALELMNSLSKPLLVLNRYATQQEEILVDHVRIPEFSSEAVSMFSGSGLAFERDRASTLKRAIGPLADFTTEQLWLKSGEVRESSRENLSARDVRSHLAMALRGSDSGRRWFRRDGITS